MKELRDLTDLATIGKERTAESEKLKGTDEIETIALALCSQGVGLPPAFHEACTLTPKPERPLPLSLSLFLSL